MKHRKINQEIRIGENGMRNKGYDTALVILVGLPSVGKSTWVKDLLKDWDFPAIWLSSDKIREEHDWKISNNKVFSIMWDRVKKGALENKYIIYDATNLRAKNRIHLTKQYSEFCEKNNLSYGVECLLFLQPIEVALERNAKRKLHARVPDEVIWRMAKQFQFPMIEEGFNNIVVATSSEGKFLNLEEISAMPQDNPHHSLNLGEHLCAAEGKALDRNYCREVCSAALYHDIGKYWTKKIGEDGVAHFYGHENIGAYILALHFLKHGKLMLDMYYNIVCLVNYHMRPYAWEKNKQLKEKEKKFFGKEFYNHLIELHECDEAAH